MGGGELCEEIIGAKKHTELKCQAPEEGPLCDRDVNKTEEEEQL